MEIQRTGKTRGTTSVYRCLATAALESVKQHSCSVTGTPVAAYLDPPFGAQLTGCIHRRLPCCLAPTDNSLKGYTRGYLFLLKRL